MWPFKKRKEEKRQKKTYIVEYRDAWMDYGNSIVKAYDAADAWERVRNQHYNVNTYRPVVCMSIKEVREDMAQ